MRERERERERESETFVGVNARCAIVPSDACRHAPTHAEQTLPVLSLILERMRVVVGWGRRQIAGVQTEEGTYQKHGVGYASAVQNPTGDGEGDTSGRQCENPSDSSDVSHTNHQAVEKSARRELPATAAGMICKDDQDTRW